VPASTTTATTTVPTSTTTTGASAPSTSAATRAVVVAASSRGSVGVVLTDGADGPTLYRYTPDGTGPSTCTSVCAQAWPPLTVPSASMVSPGSGVAGTALGTVPRSGGTLQVT
jgi:predicted lipoprotein with Yx(FWY)xxD motif